MSDSSCDFSAQPLTNGRPPCSIQCICHMNGITAYGYDSHCTDVLRSTTTHIRSTPNDVRRTWSLQRAGPKPAPSRPHSYMMILIASFAVSTRSNTIRVDLGPLEGANPSRRFRSHASSSPDSQHVAVGGHRLPSGNRCIARGFRSPILAIFLARTARRRR